jgi:hypothetical protein
MLICSALFGFVCVVSVKNSSLYELKISISAGVTGTLTKGAAAPYHVGPGDGGTKAGTITIEPGAFGGQALDVAL